jgi:GNAT superfamily N-acetyltransferase
MTIRRAVPADVPHLVELIGYGALPGQHEEPSDLEAYQKALAEIQATTHGDIFVADLDGEVVGLCQVVVFRHFQRQGGLCAEIESMHVHPDHRSNGIGARLLAAAVEAARDAGCYRVQLTSNLQRTDAHRFYERQGFVPSHVGFKRLLG